MTVSLRISYAAVSLLSAVVCVSGGDVVSEVSSEISDEVSAEISEEVSVVTSLSDMLSSLREEEMPAHEFSEDFRESLLEEVRRNERKPVRTQLVLRRCIAALLSVVVGLSLFFGLNTEARAAALQWAKKHCYVPLSHSNKHVQIVN